ncbi:hypothetical protein CFY87_06750 [Actinobacillus seminis]|uniref:Type I restriction modification DNA specificity domain-containing protein n=2 Tax=Actinobacillus seminis TaxID=722 RepID=A0ABX4FN61_9PAST|nr:hypothetical protein CFY87_06750 [Actinobacillus seminis]
MLTMEIYFILGQQFFSPHIWNGKKVIYHYHIWKVEVSEKLDKFFLLQLLKADKSLTSNTNGSTMIHITKSEIENKFIKFPSIKEQQKIGLFFKQLDDTIALHQRKYQNIGYVRRKNERLF